MEIAAALELFGIDAERRSIYRDIEEINIVNWILENQDSTIEDAEEAPKGLFDEPLRASLFAVFSVPPEKFSKSVTRFVTQKSENPRKQSVFGGFGGDYWTRTSGLMRVKHAL